MNRQPWADPDLVSTSTGLTAVLVERMPFGASSFTGAVADVFTADELTVTWTHNQQIAKVFKPGTWRTATVLDERGNPLASFVSSEEQRTNDEHFAAAMARRFPQLAAEGK